ncbi:stabilizer of axonemal microtubules 1-like isoform X2 [Pseudoliparis swirei]|nr:stabilizer of axonemal microtubules 1-like isoform X2 [Pseudoliparis swirei]
MSRKYFCSPIAQPRPSFTTEYQERFLPPHCHTTLITSSTQRNPYHTLKGTSAEINTLRSFGVTKKLANQPQHDAPLRSESPKHHRRCSSITHNPTHFGADQMAANVEDYTSVYRRDFQVWKVKKLLPYKPADSLTVNQGLVVTGCPFQNTAVQVAADSLKFPEVRKAPFESVTSYRSDYVTHPVQTRHRVKPTHPTKDLLAEPDVPLKPRVAWDQDICDEANSFFQSFKDWSIENKIHSKGHARESGPPPDDLSTALADNTEHECRRAKPGPAPQWSRGTAKERSGGTTTMKEDFRCWDKPRRFPSVRKEEPDRPEETTPQTFRHHPKSDEKASSWHASKTSHWPDEKGALSNLKGNKPETEDSKMYWTRSLDRGVSWADGGEVRQRITCMVSSRS